MKENLEPVFSDIVAYTKYMSGVKLRSYQEQVARTVVESVLGRKGHSIVVVFPRQSGKNEVQAHIETYLLTLFQETGAEIVKVSPTWRPQSLNAVRMLKRVLDQNKITYELWGIESGYIIKVGNARVTFLSGAPTAHVVGATANILLECDEAQDILKSKWDKDFAPMGASGNATTVFWGTTWTRDTLLARELRAAGEAEQLDGVQRAFVLNANDVAAEVPAYGEYVAGKVARMGRDHLLVKTQYFSEEVDSDLGLFPAARRALMQGTHPPLLAPVEGEIYALLLDLAGEDERRGDAGPGTTSLASLKNPKRDSTALTVVRVELSTLADDLIRAPSYHVVSRYLWTGVKHSQLYGQIKALADHWKARYLIVDATGVGAGLASFLQSALPNIVIPFVFTTKSKSDLGWNFLAAIDAGRYKEYRVVSEKSEDAEATPQELAKLQAEFWRQVEHCINTLQQGPGEIMRWEVPKDARDENTGEVVHDDLLVSAALCCVLDNQKWGRGISVIIEAPDIFEGMAPAL